MVKVFRHLRQGVFTEGKFSNYLLYAVGEIILIVIGILIALAINNSHENRLKQEKEQLYLSGLQKEFQISKMKLEELIRVNRQSYEGATRILQYSSAENSAPGEKEFSELLFNTFAFDVAFNPNNSLLQEMISSGSLRDLSSSDLRILLTTWISTLDDISKQEDELAGQREKVLGMLRSNAYSLRTILDMTGISTRQIGLTQRKDTVSNLGLLNSREFENNVLMFILSSQATESAHYIPLMQDIDDILVLLNDERKP